MALLLVVRVGGCDAENGREWRRRELVYSATRALTHGPCPLVMPITTRGTCGRDVYTRPRRPVDDPASADCHADHDPLCCFAGCAGVAVGHPLDTVKVRRWVGDASTWSTH